MPRTAHPEFTPNALVIRGLPVWRTWVRELASNQRESINSLVDKALVAYAQAHGFVKPPPQRTIDRLSQPD